MIKIYITGQTNNKTMLIDFTSGEDAYLWAVRTFDGSETLDIMEEKNGGLMDWFATVEAHEQKGDVNFKKFLKEEK